jgi:cytochrome c oxidase cbb3-type subunit III
MMLNDATRSPRRYHPAIALGILLIAGIAGGLWFSRVALRSELLEADPSQILKSPTLLGRAVRAGAPIYHKHCEHCHGIHLEGDPKRGVPDLARHYWLYGNDPVDVEHTIYYGIRSGNALARNVAEMPPLIRTGQITRGDGRDVVQYLESLSGQSHDSAAALRGHSIYYGKGNCFDCHANDARGVTDYGTPPLRGPVWLYGGDPETLYQSVLNGRHGQCPAWFSVLTPLEIRAVTVFLLNSTAKNPGHT